jgi:hypothetical protein
MVDEVAEIEAAKLKDVAVIEATQASNTEEASNFITTLDKLQEFKRYTLALVVLGIWGGIIALMGVGILVLIYKGQSAEAIDATKWLVALVGISVSGILGFYFGSNSDNKPV